MSDRRPDRDAPEETTVVLAKILLVAVIVIAIAAGLLMRIRRYRRGRSGRGD